MNDTPHLLTRTFDSLSIDANSDSTAWLAPAEQDELARWRDPRRRCEWLGGRWLLKGMLQRRLVEDSRFDCPAELCEIEILSRDGLGRGRPPRALVAGRLLPWHVSLAHDSGSVWAAVSVDCAVRVGIDVVRAEPTPQRANEMWFTLNELRRLQRSEDYLLGTTLWAVKEAVYKATNRGEPFVPARIDVTPETAESVRWFYHGVPCGENDSVRISRTGRSIVVVASLFDVRRRSSDLSTRVSKVTTQSGRLDD